MFKKMFFMVMLLVVIMVPVFAKVSDAATTFSLLTQALMPLIIIIVSPLLARLFKKAGIDIEDSVLEPILMRIIEIIARVDNTELSGEQKKDFVTKELNKTFSEDEKKTLVKRYGSLDTAVQAAFEKSSVAFR